jgi:hypothetical protein
MAYDEEYGREISKTDSGESTRFTGKWLSTYGESANHIPDSMRVAREKPGSRWPGGSLCSAVPVPQIQPGLQNLRIDYLAPECGVRETTTILGKGTVVQDYASGRRWKDAVCYFITPSTCISKGPAKWISIPYRWNRPPSAPGAAPRKPQLPGCRTVHLQRPAGEFRPAQATCI